MLVEVLIFLFMIFIAFSAFIAYKLVKPPRFIKNWTPEDFGYKYEDVTIETRDGLKLSAWWVPNEKDSTVIPLHGYTRSRWDEVYMKQTTEFLLREGYSVLVFDFRAHGKSGGNYTTVGERELVDVISAVDWLEKNHPEKAGKIGLVGFSMGAVVTIRALAEDERVTCGVADSPPIYLDRTGARGLKYFANLPEWLYAFVKPFTKLFSGAKELNMLAYAEKIRKPLLLIAGEKDPLVKVDEVKEFYERNKKVNPNVELWVTDSPHVRTLKFHPEEWKAKVGDFLRRHL
ncbi:alpha/beta fold hydrolase [Thermococcus sp.]|uniref:alpha/beta hydrolase n=1 Tax=Thermococcus sp. TaxID=35749 RepID=UPI002616613F|nr:alpha/beta fold hydrolase [Thermococcus sp.]